MAEDTTTQVVRRSGLETIEASEAIRLADDLVRSAITSLKTPITIPSTTGVDLTSPRAEVERARATRDETAETIDAERVRLGQAAEDQKEAIEAEGKAASDKILADQATVELQADLQRKFADVFGISLDPAADIAIAAERMRQLRPGAEEKLRRVQKMQSVGMLDNPLEWLANQIQLPAAIGDYNAEAQLINSIQSTIDASIKTGQDAASFAQKGIPTISAASAKADADKILAKAQENKAIADSNLAKNSVTFANQQLANDITIANADKAMSQLDIANEHTRYQSLVNAINLADSHANRLLKAAQLLEKLEGTKGLDIIFENYDRTMGHPKGTTTRYTFEKFNEARRQDIVAIGSGSMGADPFEGMLNWYRNRPGPGATIQTQRFADYIRNHAEIISVRSDVQPLDEKQKPAKISSELKKQISMDITNASTPGNHPFYEMSPATMIASKAIPADSQLAKILETFTKQTGNIPTAVVLEAINNEWKNPVEAGAVIADYYSKNMQLRNSVMNTSIFGIQLPTNYRIKQAPLADLPFTAKMPFDLTKPEEATKWVLINRANKQAGAALGTFGKFN